MSQPIYGFEFKKIDGAPATLADYRGKVLVVVNVASKCGFTPQYDGLEKIYEKYKDRGLEVLGFPANEFGAQEPGTNSEIQQFCRMNFGLQFPMFEKIVVKGPGQHPLYKHLTGAKPAAKIKDGTNFEGQLKEYGVTRENKADILWNFEKFLIGRDGQVLERFNPDIEPEDQIITSAIEKALASPA